MNELFEHVRYTLDTENYDMKYEQGVCDLATKHAIVMLEEAGLLDHKLYKEFYKPHPLTDAEAQDPKNVWVYDHACEACQLVAKAKETP